jgi:hypothetical protein
MLEYIFLEQRTDRPEKHGGLQLILKPQSCLKKLESASAWKVSIPPYKLPNT